MVRSAAGALAAAPQASAEAGSETQSVRSAANTCRGAPNMVMDFLGRGRMAEDFDLPSRRARGKPFRIGRN
jgi:hypothetical protein